MKDIFMNLCLEHFCLEKHGLINWKVFSKYLLIQNIGKKVLEIYS